MKSLFLVQVLKVLKFESKVMILLEVVRKDSKVASLKSKVNNLPVGHIKNSH